MTEINVLGQINTIDVAQLHLEYTGIVAGKPILPGEKSLAHRRPRLFKLARPGRRTHHSAVVAMKLQGEKFANVKFHPANHSPSRRPPK